MPLCAVNTKSKAHAFLRQARLLLARCILPSGKGLGYPPCLLGRLKAIPEKQGHRGGKTKAGGWGSTSRALSVLIALVGVG